MVQKRRGYSKHPRFLWPNELAIVYKMSYSSLMGCFLYFWTGTICKTRFQFEHEPHKKIIFNVIAGGRVTHATFT